MHHGGLGSYRDYFNMKHATPTTDPDLPTSDPRPPDRHPPRPESSLPAGAAQRVARAAAGRQTGSRTRPAPGRLAQGLQSEFATARLRVSAQARPRQAIRVVAPAQA